MSKLSKANDALSLKNSNQKNKISKKKKHDKKHKRRIPGPSELDNPKFANKACNEIKEETFTGGAPYEFVVRYLGLYVEHSRRDLRKRGKEARRKAG